MLFTIRKRLADGLLESDAHFSACGGVLQGIADDVEHQSIEVVFVAFDGNRWRLGLIQDEVNVIGDR